MRTALVVTIRRRCVRDLKRIGHFRCRAIPAGAIMATPLIAVAMFLAAVAGTAPPAGAAELPVVVDARTVGDQSRSRFVADLTVAVSPTVFLLADPYRMVIDMPEVTFDLPEGAGEEGRGLMSAYRFGLISAGKSRIVVDLAGPVAIDKAFVTRAEAGQPARIVIDAVPASRETHLAVARAFHERRTAAAGPGISAAGDVDLPLIVVDPGHGGIDTGAKGAGGAIEKDVVLAFSKALVDRLEATGRYRVIATRDTDVFVGLRERVKIAREAAGDLFVSIHANSFRGRTVRGAIVYTVSEEASDKMAAELAASENRSDVLAGVALDPDEGDEVRDILLDLTRRETRNFEMVLARTLVDRMSESVEMFKKPHQTAGFMVLEAPDIPSALIELGYLTNPTDEDLLVSPEWQDKAAVAIVEAIDDFFAARRAGAGYAPGAARLTTQ